MKVYKQLRRANNDDVLARIERANYYVIAPLLSEHKHRLATKNPKEKGQGSSCFRTFDLLPFRVLLTHTLYPL